MAALTGVFALVTATEVDLAEARKRKRKRRKRRKRKRNRGSSGGGGDGLALLGSEERACFDLINAYRRRQGRQQLSVQPQLQSAAERHSNDQAANDFSDHSGSDGSTIAERITAAGYRYSHYGENIYWKSGDGSADAAFAWWKSSDDHDANMLSKDFTEIGIARARSVTTGRWYWTTDFGRPR